MKRKSKKALLEEGSLTLPGRENPRCMECGLFSHATTPFMRLSAPPSGPIEVVAVSSPTREDDELYKSPVKGGWNALIRSILAGITPQVAYLTAVLCYSPTLRAKNFRMCSPFVRREIISLYPEKIICFGQGAMLSVLGEKVRKFEEVVGGVFEVEGMGYSIPVLVTYHPAGALVHNRSEVFYGMKRHVERFLGVSSPNPQHVIPLFPGVVWYEEGGE